ncbi:hypothetical protein CKO42_25385 [Lamprobacter modestohalophilus]|uniref:Aminotransferase class I/II-fold pyridoxal phosphate-dependent enzyme n=1 Tax=Lamprobacter modestohalophilus TaxID=1064514 RepID=A0A9X0WDX6_9GAMM|nr:aminotransferase class I/II-fold pyridoxal phosphate-dependent enzyme [Lamprobacter modestohalophilus]MBK1621664.1 hypothetical protein [Lamprobacter modestohalophilus]
MRMLDDDVKRSVFKTIEAERLFRYDCEVPYESITSRLEDAFAKAVGSRYCVAVNSCSSGLFLSMVTAGVAPGDRVAIPSFTFIAVPSAVVHVGATPMLVEMTEDYVMDLGDFERKIADGTVKALMLSYMRGRVPDIDRVMKLCERYNVLFLEDAAHSLGVLYKGKQTGTFGISGAFSAQSNKMIDGGEGGLFVTDEKQIAFETMLYAGCYEDNWKKHFGTHEDEARLADMTNRYPAYNFRMSNLSAAALLPQISKVEARAERFNANYGKLVEIIGAHPNIRIPSFTDGVRPASDSIQWEFVGLTDDQIARIGSRLIERAVKIDIFTGGNARCFWNWGFFEHAEHDCPATRNMISRTVDMRLKLFFDASAINAIGKTVVHTIDEILAET